VRRHEVLLLILHGPAGYRLVVPEDQLATPTSVVYTPPSLAAGESVILALHSHHTLPAFFSATDDADEQGLGLYAVVGRLLGAPRGTGACGCLRPLAKCCSTRTDMPNG